MKSELYQEYKEAFHKEHIQQIAQAEASKIIDRHILKKKVESQQRNPYEKRKKLTNLSPR